VLPINGVLIFEKQVKISSVPLWNGNSDTTPEWLDNPSRLAYPDQSIYHTLIQTVPLRFTDAAQRGFHVREPPMQKHTQQSWGSLNIAKPAYFINQQWFNGMNTQVLRVRHRQNDWESDAPRDDFHCKRRMIQDILVPTSYKAIAEVTNGAPQYWNSLIDTPGTHAIADLQSRIKYHGKGIIKSPQTQSQDLERQLKVLNSRPAKQSSKSVRTHGIKAKTTPLKKQPFKQNFVGAHSKSSDYKHPKNNNIMLKGRTLNVVKGKSEVRICYE
jgi:hypothetical protein